MQREQGAPEDLGIAGLEDAELIGRGGAAVVYKATQTNLQRTVAVKLLTSSWDESVARRFDREQRAMGRLSNRPGIVPVYESGLSDRGIPYIVMPFYPAGSLKDWSEDKGPVDWQQAAEIVLDVALALGRAHEEGVVHRDLKPANILIGNNGQPLLADFGIARLNSDGLGLETTAVTFTPAYCPPEVMDEAEPDPRADTYALGATFWALIRGHPPFTDPDGADLGMDAILKRVLLESPERLEHAPNEVADLIEQSMSKNPDERPANGGVFAERLRISLEAHATDQRTSDDATVVATSRYLPPTPTSDGEPAVQPQRSKGRKWLYPALVAIVLTGGLVAFASLRGSLWPAAVDSTAEATPSRLITVDPGEPLTLQVIGAESDEPTSEQVRRAAELAIDHFGSVGDIEVQVLPTLAVDCADPLGAGVRSTLEQTEASVLLGSTCLDAVMPIMALASERAVTWISPNLTAPSLTANAAGSAGIDHIDGFFRTSLNQQFQGAVAAQFALDELDARTAVVVHGLVSGHADIAGSFRAAFEQSGDVTLIEFSNEGDLEAIASQLEQASADVSFWVLDAEAAGNLAGASDRFAGDRIAVDAALSESTVRQSTFSDTFVVMGMTPTDNDLSGTGRSFGEIVTAYSERYGEPPSNLLELAAAYDATVLALEALVATLDETGNPTSIDRYVLRDHLETAESDGVTGPLTCNFLGDCGSQAMVIVQVDGSSLSTTAENVQKLYGRAG